MHAFSRSWNLLKSTLQILRAEKSLALYPILAAAMILITSLLIIGTAYTLILFFPELAQLVQNLAATTEPGDSLQSWLLGGFFAVLYCYFFLIYLIIYFFMTGLAGAALMRLDGQDPTLADGLKIAMSRIKVIAGFALLAATIGLMLSLLRNRNNSSGGLLALFGGMTWNIASFLVVPLMAAKQIGPIAALKESAALLRKCWGEQLIGMTGFGLVFSLLIVTVVLATGGLVSAIVDFNQPLLIFIVLAFSVMLLAGLVILNSTLNAIYRVAVYRYAATGSVVNNFDSGLITQAFHVK